jgi:hypothetical protein
MEDQDNATKSEGGAGDQHINLKVNYEGNEVRNCGYKGAN